MTTTETRSPGRPPTAEGLVVGATMTSDPITFTSEQLRTHARLVDTVLGAVEGEPAQTPCSGAPLGLVDAAVDRWLAGVGIRPASGRGWSGDQAVRPDVPVRLRMLVTGVEPTTGGECLMRLAIDVVAPQDTVVLSTHVVATADVTDGAGPDAGASPGSRAWLASLQEELNASEEFRTCTSTWDGAIGIGMGATEALLRVYKGRVIDVGSRLPLGPTFTVSASERTWTELLTGPVNDMTRRVMRGEFSSRGNAYEYLRHTRTLNAIVDVMREITNRKAS